MIKLDRVRGVTIMQPFLHSELSQDLWCLLDKEIRIPVWDIIGAEVYSNIKIDLEKRFYD